MILRNTTSYIIPGTKYFRLSSRAVLGEFGTNLQNIEDSARRMYIPSEGKRFNQRDQAGAEALIVAYLCRAGRFRELFTNSIKPHVFVGLHVFKEKWKEVISQKEYGDIKCDIDELCNTAIPDLRKNPWWKQVDKLIKSSDTWPPSIRYYYIAKQICHSSNYGIKAGMFCLNTLEKSKGKIALRKRDAEMFLDMYHSLFPEIREWHSRVEKQVRETRILYNLLGDPIQFTGDIENESALKEAFSAIPQSTVGQIANLACTKIQEFIEDTAVDWDLMQNNHDSFLVQAPDSDEECIKCQKIMKVFIEPEMESPVDGVKFNMRSEGSWGYNWGKYKEKDNPKGLREVEI